MRERKVWKLFSLLRSTEKLDFQKWLLLEYGDKQQYVQKLYACLLNQPSAPNVQEVWEALYLSDPYDDARMRKLCRDLCSQLESFLAYQNIKSDRRGLELALLRELNQREASELFLKTSRKIKRSLNGVKGKDAAYFRYCFELELEIQRYLSKYVRSDLQKEKLFPNQYGQMMNSFDSWWAEEKLELALGKINRKSREKIQAQELLLDELLEKLRQDTYWQSNDRIQVYVQVYRLLSGKDKQGVGILLGRIRKTDDQWTQEELSNFLTSLINANIRKLNQLGEEETAIELFSLFEWGISSRLFFIDNNLPEVIYKNLLTICLKVKKFDKALNYLETLKELLPENRQEECYRFNLGRYYFAKGAFKEVISCLAGQKFSNVFDEIDARIHLLQAQYEIEYEDPDWIARQIQTLARFVRNQNIPQQFKVGMGNGFRLFRKLVLAYTPYEHEQVLKLIQQTRPLNKAKWLEEKAKLRSKKRPESYPAS
ncbi:MAG: hypothetical protein AAFR87_00895 [Bacteroidota bacterium]